MSEAAEQRSPAGLLLKWSAEHEQWTGELEDGPFRLELVARVGRCAGVWLVLLRDLTGRAEMMREWIEIEVPEATQEAAIVERLQELGEQWKSDPSLVFTGWGKP